MSFITDHRKIIAVAVTFSFVYLIGVASLPLAGDQQPGAIEKIGTSGTPSAKKSPIIPIIIGVVVVGAVAALLILVVFKTKYDITGTWTGSSTDQVFDTTRNVTITFSGDKKSGTLVLTTEEGQVFPGIYLVDGKDVTYTADMGMEFTFTCIGSFSDEDHLSGTWQMSNNESYGIWTLARSAAI